MRSVIDAATLDLQEKLFPSSQEIGKRQTRHLGKRGDFLQKLRGIEPVDLIGQMAVAEQSEYAVALSHGEEAVPIARETVTTLSVEGERVAGIHTLLGIEKFHPASQKDIDDSRVLRGDEVLVIPVRRHGRETRGSGVRDGRRSDQAGAVAQAFQMPHDGHGLGSVGADVHGAIIDLHAAAPCRGGCGGIRDV